jgi:hypothetical protein
MGATDAGETAGKDAGTSQLQLARRGKMVNNRSGMRNALLMIRISTSS